jgi:hypothetical protein
MARLRKSLVKLVSASAPTLAFVVLLGQRWI